MYFDDLTRYSYRWPKEFANVLNVGWLDAAHSYPRGGMPEPFLSKLREIIAGSSTVDVHVNRMRGIHPCNLCGEDTVIVKGGSKGVYLGASEVWIPADGTYYASPSMVLHYIEKHDYCPPRQYIDAVTAFDMTKAFSGQRAYDELVMSRTSSSGHAERR